MIGLLVIHFSGHITGTSWWTQGQHLLLERGPGFVSVAMIFDSCSGGTQMNPMPHSSSHPSSLPCPRGLLVEAHTHTHLSLFLSHRIPDVTYKEQTALPLLISKEVSLHCF